MRERERDRGEGGVCVLPSLTIPLQRVGWWFGTSDAEDAEDAPAAVDEDEFEREKREEKRR